MSPASLDAAPAPGTLWGLLLVFGVAVVLSLLLTPLVRDLALRRGFVDRPDGGRKIHPVAVPRLGGVAVYLAFVLSFGFFLVTTGWGTNVVLAEAYAPLVVGCTAVLLVGLADDLVGVSPWTKVLVQVAGGLYLFYNGYQVRLLSNPFGEQLALGALSLPVTVLWVVGMSNAFNLIDGLDGLAAGVGLFSTSTVLVAALLNGRWEVALLAVALAGALFGFLRYNFNPASIFLGDSGSLLVGFALAAFAIRGSMKSSTAIAVAAPLLALALPILDTTIAMVRRLLTGKRLFEADAEHIHHRLLRRGMTPLRVVLVLYAVAGVFGALSLLTMTGQSQIIGLVVIVFSVVTWSGVRALGYPEFADIGDRLRRSLGFERIPPAGPLEELRSLLREAPDIAAFWGVLTRCAPGLGVRSLELQLARETRPFLRWKAEDPVSPEALWSSSVPLVAGLECLATLTLTRPLPEAGDSLLVSHLVEVCARDGAEALARIRATTPPLASASEAQRH